MTSSYLAALLRGMLILHFKNKKPLEMFNLEEVKDLFEELLRKGKEFVDNLQKKNEKKKENMNEQTSIVLRSMVEKGILKKSDFEKIDKELNK